MSGRDDVVLPVGFQLGPEPSIADGTDDAKVRVRVGWTVHSLTRPQWQIWRLAHGSWSTQRSGWSRSDVLTAVRERAVDTGKGSAEQVFDDLRMRGLVGVVRLDAPSAGFVANHRVDPLLTGIGALPDAGETGMLIGAIGKSTRVALEPAAYHFWRSAGDHASLLALHEAAVNAATYDRMLSFQTDDDLLRELLALTQFLVSRGAMWVDRRWEPRPEELKEEWE